MPFIRIHPSTALLGASLLLSATLACSWLAFPVLPGDVLFQDDFSRTDSGWDRYQDDISFSDYVDGAYRINVLRPNTDAWSNPGLSFTDVRIEVNATKVGGPDDNLIGVLCRYQDPKNFYFLLISSDGYAGIGLYKDDRQMLLSGDAMLPTEAILRGTATNHLRADCVGHKLALYVNGALVAQAQASEWSTGDVGLIAGTYDQPGVDISFDNFSVLKPEPGILQGQGQ